MRGLVVGKFPWHSSQQIPLSMSGNLLQVSSVEEVCPFQCHWLCFSNSALENALEQLMNETDLIKISKGKQKGRGNAH